MALNLAKEKTINLTKSLPNQTKFTVGLGWDKGSDLDASAIVLKDGVRTDIVYYDANSRTAAGLIHSGDNRTGEGEGDDEQIGIDLSQVNGNEVIITITSYSVGEPVTFGASRNPVARLLGETGQELVTAKLDETAAFCTAVEFVRFTKDENGDWSYKNVSEVLGSSANGLQDVVTKYA